MTERSREELIARLELYDEWESRQAGKSLHAFMRFCWPMLEPSRPFKDNWHIGAICEHLEAVHAGQIKNLLVNQPPATTKSLTVSVAFPAWVWARDPTRRFMCLSYDQRLATRDSLRMRQLVQSPLYQTRWPVELIDDQNQKTRYQTAQGGWRISLGMTSGIVGEHPHGKIVDDPHNTTHRILTEPEIDEATDTWVGLSVRGATLDAWTVLLMQRLHERDLSGHWLATAGEDIVHLCLPMRYEPPVWVEVGGRPQLVPRMRTTPLGWSDPRTVPGELLWPEEWPLARVEDKVRTALGPFGEAGQFQQRPSAAGGSLFRAEWFVMVAVAPADVTVWVRYWDVAATEGGSGPRTAGVLMGRTRGGQYVIGDVVKDRLAPKGVDDLIYQTAVLDGRTVQVREEHEGGSAGKAVVAARAVRLAGFDYAGVHVAGRGSKEERAHPLVAQAASGNVLLVVGAEADATQRRKMRELVDELCTFPTGALKDQVDAAAGAFNVLTAANVGDQGLLFSGSDPAELEDEIARLERELGLTS